MRRLGLLLTLALVARAGDENVVHIYDLTDLKEWGGEAWWSIALSRARAASEGGAVVLREGTLVVTATPAVQEKVGKAILDVRKAFDVLVTFDVRVVRIEGGAGVATVPADKIDAFLKEKGATDVASPNMTFRNGCEASLEVHREISYVSDFEVSLDGVGGVIADPVVSTAKDGVSVKLRPFVGKEGVRVVAETTATEATISPSTLELPYPVARPLEIQVPETTSWSVTRLVTCSSDAFTVVKVGGPWVVLLRPFPRTKAEAAPK